MNVALPPRWALPRACHVVFVLCAGALAGGCAEDRDFKAEAADRSRQMRDVSRMLDAMESPPDPALTVVPAPARTASIGVPPPTKARPTMHGVWPGGVAAAAVIAFLALVLGMAWRRRKRRTSSAAPPALSIAESFEPVTPPAPPEDAAMAPPPTPDWTYKRTAYEAPTLQLALEPVDLLARPRAPGASVDRLHAPGMPACLYLSGEREHPTLRHVGDHADDVVAWEAIVRDYLNADGEEGYLARWLLPALHRAAAPLLDRQAAEARLDEALALCQAALDTVPPARRPWWRAHQLRTGLARLTRSSGATRLLALRELGSDEHDHDAPALDAWVDVHLAWAGWLVGHAAQARLGVADGVCERLGTVAPVLASKRRADVFLQRASLAKGDARLVHLDAAHALLLSVANDSGDPAVRWTLAHCIHQRATLLPPDAAAEACSDALGHAFAIGQHPAWHIASLELRLAIQLTHDTLPGHGTPNDVAGSLRRELASARSRLRTGTA
ncbi:hypothetical protein [Luteibacter pinisoli]|uniref:hypothetical protein n=1 Tax=Luteibacter pinisoli TaxID=2589080 RepID=UPI001476FBB6|nr:hypothetical protein [Luteibacter pinisoli]